MNTLLKAFTFPLNPLVFLQTDILSSFSFFIDTEWGGGQGNGSEEREDEEVHIHEHERVAGQTSEQEAE